MTSFVNYPLGSVCQFRFFGDRPGLLKDFGIISLELILLKLSEEDVNLVGNGILMGAVHKLSNTFDDLLK